MKKVKSKILVHSRTFISRLLNGRNVLFFIFLFASCKKFVQVDPPTTQIVTSTVYTNDATAKSAMEGIYVQMMSTSAFANGVSVSTSFLSGLSSDEFKNYAGSTSQASFYTNSLDANNSIVNSSFWKAPYQFIWYANSVMEGLVNSTGVSEKMKKELTGEAKFIRAFCHFYLTNLFGDVPLVLSTDYKKNSKASRQTKAIVLSQIIDDLKDAQSLLTQDYSFSNDERIRPNKWAATALLARVYLYMKDWKSAELQSSDVINQTSLYDTVPLNNVFLKNSQEAIWQLMPVVSGLNTNEGINFIITGSPNNLTISSQLLSAFEAGDNRKSQWIGSINISGNTFYFPYKYKIKATGQPLTEYSMVLRLAEQYLIRAEARAQQNDLTGAKNDLNIIRNRAGLANTSAASQQDLLTAVLHERQVELFSEWGHRWFDLKRTGLADVVLSSVKGSNWQSTDVLYPIPQTEINNDPNLSQNPGY